MVDAPFSDPLKAALLGLGIVVLLLVNKKSKTIDRIALSNTEPAKGTVKVTEKPFRSIKIPINHPQNIIAKAIATGKPQRTTDWQYLFTPALDPQAARINQAGGGIAGSYVYPLKNVGNGGALIFSYYLLDAPKAKKREAFMKKYQDMVSGSLSRYRIHP